MILGEKLIPTIHEFIKIIPEIDFKPLAEAFTLLLKASTGLSGIFIDLFGSFSFGIDKANGLHKAINFIGVAVKSLTAPLQLTTNLIKGMIDAFIHSKKIFSGLAYMATGQFQTGLDLINSGISEYKNLLSNRKMQSGPAPAGATNGPNPFSVPAPPGVSSNSRSSLTSGGNSATKAGIEKISSATRNVTLNINKLIENLNFTKDQNKNEFDMEEMVKRVLLKAVNDVNLVQ